MGLALNLAGTNSVTTNRFNHITNTSAGAITIIISVAAGSSSVYSNVIDSVSSTTGILIGISVGTNTSTNNIYSNTIDSFANTSGAITGITSTGTTGNANIYSNNIHTLNSSIAGVVTGVSVTAGNATYNKNVYKNKIFDLESGGSGGTVNGILVSGGITVNVHNNTIGDLRTPTANAADVIRGISITNATALSNVNVYYNTIYLNATSSGTNFGTSGIFHTSNATATTAALDMRNNIITNTSTANGTGFTVAYRRSSTVLTNYASTSNRNLFYGNVPSSANLIFYDGTNSDQTLSAYKARVASMDANSVSENLIGSFKFLSTTGSSANFLHLDPTKATQAESGGAAIASYNDDFDGDIRQGSGGYAGSGSAPDIGADEFNGTALTGLSGTYTVGTAGNYLTLTGVGGLFEDISTRGLSGNVTAQIISDLTEAGTNALSKWTETGAGAYTVHIVPSAATPQTYFRKRCYWSYPHQWC